MSSFETHNLLGNASGLDHIHEALKDIDEGEPDVEAEASSNISSDTRPRRQSLSKRISVKYNSFSARLQGSVVTEEAKMMNLEHANAAREARKLALEMKRKEEEHRIEELEKLKEDNKPIHSPASRSLFGNGGKFRRASASRRRSLKESQELNPFVMKAQNIVLRVKSNPQGTENAKDVVHICDLLDSLIAKDPQIAKKLVSLTGEAALTATTESVVGAASTTSVTENCPDLDEKEEQKEEEDGTWRDRDDDDDDDDHDKVEIVAPVVAMPVTPKNVNTPGDVEKVASSTIAQGVGRSRRESEVNFLKPITEQRDEHGECDGGAGVGIGRGELNQRETTKNICYKEEIIGCRIAVKGGDGVNEGWYDGVVISYHPTKTDSDTGTGTGTEGYHHVVFGDGIEATLDLSKEEMYLAEE